MFFSLHIYVLDQHLLSRPLSRNFASWLLHKGVWEFHHAMISTFKVSFVDWLKVLRFVDQSFKVDFLIHEKKWLISCMIFLVIWRILVGGWTNPIEKYDRQIASFSQFSGWKIQKSLSCHHPDSLIAKSNFNAFGREVEHWNHGEVANPSQ